MSISNLYFKNNNYILDYVLDHVNFICKKTGREKIILDENTRNNIFIIIDHHKQFIDIKVLEHMKGKLWLEWHKDLEGKNRGFLPCFVIALQKSIPLTYDQILHHFIDLKGHYKDFVIITEEACQAYLQKPMVFQYGSIKFIKNIANSISKSNYKKIVRTTFSNIKNNKKKQNKDPLEWWNIIADQITKVIGKRNLKLNPEDFKNLFNLLDDIA